MANKGAGSGNFFMGSGAKFGLTLNPKRAPKKPVLAAPLAAFGADAEEEQDDAGNNFRGARELAREQEANSVANARVQAMHAKALAEDPSVFDYDGVVDHTRDERKMAKQDEKLKRESRYITQIMHHTKGRQREQDIIYERQLLKERQKEDHLYGDKEKFVTAGYKKKLQEDEKWAKEEALRLKREEEDDVTKKGDMSGLYRNLLKTNTKYGGAATTGAASERAATMGAASERAATTEAASEAAPAPVRSPVAAAAAATDVERPLRPNPQDADDSGDDQEPAAACAGGGAPVAPVEAARSQAAAPAVPAAPVRNKEEVVQSARERYLARKRKAGAS